MKKSENNKLTKEWLLEFGFEQIPHFTVTNTLIINIGRRLILSVGSVGTPNEMVTLCEIDYLNSKKITDVIVLRNYDYDGYTTREQLGKIYEALTLILTKL